MTPTAVPREHLIEFLTHHVPFDRMERSRLEWLADRLEPTTVAKGEVILSPEQGVARRFFIVYSGQVRGETPDGHVADEAIWDLGPGECFPIGALLSNRPVRIVRRAVEGATCFVLSAEEFHALRNACPPFQEFCCGHLASLLGNVLGGAQERLGARADEDNSLSTPLARLIRREPIACPPTTPIRDALKRMHDAHIGSIVVVDDEHRPIGVFTLHDLLDRVVLPCRGLDLPIASAMTPSPATLERGTFAHEAALLMAERGFGHILIVDEQGRLTGVVSERDLFALQRVGLVNLSRAIPRAQDIETLASLGRDVHRLIDQMLAQGASVDQLTQIIALLNDHITRRVIDLALAEPDAPDHPFTWMAFGSEGRQEQTLKTDQDNGILFLVGEGDDAQAIRDRLLPLARRINEDLARCGFPLCPGNIMAGNPECCLSLDEWQARFDRWIYQGTPEHLLKASIYFDFRPLWGDHQPADHLRTWLLEQTEKNSRFRRQLAANALMNRPPLGLFGEIKVSGGKDAHPHTLDLKVQGVTPFVDGARLIALAHRIAETNTAARLRAAVKAEAVREEDAEAWMQAIEFINLLRMRAHQHQEASGAPLDNHSDPDELNDLDRRILKEAFRQARKLQSKISLEYQL